MLMGRPRTKNKDLPLGLRVLPSGKVNFQPTTAGDKARLKAETGKASRTFPDKPAARKWWAEFMGYRDKPIPAAGTVAELLDRFLREELPRTMPNGRPRYAAKTQKIYRFLIEKRLRPEFGQMKYARTDYDAVRGQYIRTMHVQQFLRKLESEKRIQTGIQCVSLLSSVFGAARTWGAAEYNPASGVDTKGLQTPRDRLPTRAEWDAIYAVASPPLKCAMDLVALGGLRAGMVRMLVKSDWSPEGLRYVVSKSKRHQIPQRMLLEHSPELAAVIDACYRLPASARSIYLVCNRNGGPYTEGGFGEMWRSAVAKANKAGAGVVDLHFHDLRADAATEADRQGKDASKLLGHKNRKTTDTYLRAQESRVEPLRRK